jgi:hypothetical protein
MPNFQRIVIRAAALLLGLALLAPVTSFFWPSMKDAVTHEEAKIAIHQQRDEAMGGTSTQKPLSSAIPSSQPTP